MAARKKRTTKSTQRRTKPGRYGGLYVHVARAAKTKAKKKVEAGQVLLAVGEPGDDGWVPVLVGGRLDHVQRADVERIVPKVAKPTAAQLVIRKRIIRRVLARRKAPRTGSTTKGAKRVRSKWPP